MLACTVSTPGPPGEEEAGTGGEEEEEETAQCMKVAVTPARM